MINLKSLFQINAVSSPFRWVMGATLLLMQASVTSVTAQITAGETIGAETWSGTVMVSDTVTIRETGNLTIIAGTRVEFSGKFSLIVDGGSLNVNGKEGNPVLLTVRGADPQPGIWEGVNVLRGTAVFKHCIQEFAVTGIAVQISCNHIFEHCVFRKNRAEGA